MYYLNSRYYNPDWGRFINADALGGNVGELLSHNIFAYCRNNPVNMQDPNGYRYSIIDGGVQDDIFMGRATGVLEYTRPRAKAFYTEGEGPKITVLGRGIKIGNNDNTYKDVLKSILKVQLVSGEAGMVSFYDKNGAWNIKGPYVKSDIGFNLGTRPKASLYGKVGFMDLIGKWKFSNTSNVDVTLDLGSIGGGLDIDFEKGKIVGGIHCGVGFDVNIDF